MSIRFAAGDQLNSFDQISDGVVIYTYHQIGDVSERSRVDLGRVYERLGVITQADWENPVLAMYMAIGGQAELLRKLSQQYRWIDIQPGEIGDVSVWWLTGALSKEPPAIRAFSEMDVLLQAENRSGLLPEHVRIAICRGETMRLWLYRIEQSRSRPMATVGDSHPLVAVTDFFEPQMVTNLPVEMFLDEKSESSDAPPIDETNKYLPPGAVAAQRRTVPERLR